MKELKKHQKILLFLAPILFVSSCFFLLFISYRFITQPYFKLYVTIAIMILVLSGVGAIYMNSVLDKVWGIDCPWAIIEDWDVPSEEELEEIKKIIESMEQREEKNNEQNIKQEKELFKTK